MLSSVTELGYPLLLGSIAINWLTRDKLFGIQPRDSFSVAA